MKSNAMDGKAYRQSLVTALEDLDGSLKELPSPIDPEEKALWATTHAQLAAAFTLAELCPLGGPGKRTHRTRKRAGFKRHAIQVKERLSFLEQSTKTCAYCNRPSGTIAHDPDGHSWHIDHIDPVSRGGKDHISNWALSCRACNLSKNGTPVVIWQNRKPVRKVTKPAPLPVLPVRDFRGVPIDSITPDVERLAFTPAEAAMICGISETQFTEMLNRGEVRAIQLSKKTICIPRPELERLTGIGA